MLRIFSSLIAFCRNRGLRFLEFDFSPQPFSGLKTIRKRSA